MGKKMSAAEKLRKRMEEKEAEKKEASEEMIEPTDTEDMVTTDYSESESDVVVEVAGTEDTLTTDYPESGSNSDVVAEVAGVEDTLITDYPESESDIDVGVAGTDEPQPVAGTTELEMEEPVASSPVEPKPTEPEYDEEILVSAVVQAIKNPRIAAWSPTSSMILNYIKATRPRSGVSLSAEIDGILSRELVAKYPGLHNAIQKTMRGMDMDMDIPKRRGMRRND